MKVYKKIIFILLGLLFFGVVVLADVPSVNVDKISNIVNCDWHCFSNIYHCVLNKNILCSSINHPNAPSCSNADCGGAGDYYSCFS